MTLLTPSFLQNAGSVNTAEMMRNAISIAGSAGRSAASSLKARGGVHYDIGDAMRVLQNGTPNMTVLVSSGACAVPGSEGTTQGCYFIMNDAAVSLAITAAHATLNRIDLVVVRIRDSVYSGATNTAALEIVTGTAASSPSAPALPANSLLLAQVSVPATDTTITTSQITDKRNILAAPGGVMWCHSGNRPDPAAVATGQQIYEYDTNMHRMLDVSTSWKQLTPYLNYFVLSTATHPVTFTNLPTTLRNLRITYSVRCAGALVVDNMYMTINNLAAGQYFYVRTIQQNTAVTGLANDQTLNRFPVGIITGSTGATGFMGSGVIDILNWNLPSGLRASVKWASGAYGGTAANAFNETGTGTFNDAGPLNRLDFKTGSASNFIADSYFRIEGWE
jgi:hypothetical protein